MIKKLTITTMTSNYNVYIGADIYEQMTNFFRQYNNKTKIMIITDTNLAKLHLATLNKVLKSLSLKTYVNIVPVGEKAKTLTVYDTCLTACFQAKLTKKDIIIAFGGGAVGDLAGFIASTYMRGLNFIQMPTTLLAHDSAIGGKVGINSEYGKNLIGTFYHPQAVFYHLDYLQTLPEAEWRSGFAEVIKEACIADYNLLKYLQLKIISLHDIKTNIYKLIISGMKIKANIVRQDEKEEKGVRVFLNFGHTLGHALEKTITIKHGDAVIVGILFALQLSIKYCQLDCDLFAIKAWLKSLGYLIITIPKGKSNLISEIICYMRFDKKNINATIGLVLLQTIGKPLYKQLPVSIIEEELIIFFTELNVRLM